MKNLFTTLSLNLIIFYASFATLPPALTLGTLTTTSFCVGSTASIGFTDNTYPSGHVYAVQLSDSNGSFSGTPTVLGTGQSSPISITLPSFSSGNPSNYVIRIIDQNDVTHVSASSVTINFNALTVFVETINGKYYSYVCSGSALKMYAKLNFPDNNDVVYEWKKDGSVIVGATNSTYIGNQLGTYTVKVTKTGCGVPVSNPYGFEFYSAPSPPVFYGYEDPHQCAGTILALKADYVSENAVYEWRKDSVVIANPVPSSVLNVSQTGTYSLKITDSNCQTASNYSSRKFMFGSIIPTDITTSVYDENGPNNVSSIDTLLYCANSSVFLSHRLGSVTNPYYSYQWLKNGNPLPNGTNYYIYADTEGLYSLKVTHGNCSSVSQNIYVKMNRNTSKIIVAPNGTENCPDNYVYLQFNGQVCASSQWQKDGVNIGNANSKYYYANQSGAYRVRITQNGVVSYTNVINVVISNSPSFTATNNNPPDSKLCIPHASYYFNNAPIGTNTFQWYKNNTAINFANSSSYEINSPGVYKLKFTNGSCIGYSQDINITSNPQISKPKLTCASGKLICGNTYAYLKSDYYDYVNFEWKLNGQTILVSSYIDFIDVTQSGVYTVTLSQTGCSTTSTSDPFTINIGDKQQSIKNSNWNDATMWSCGTVPTISEDILINKGHTISIPNNYTGFAKDLQLNGILQYGTNSLLKSKTN